MISFKEMSASEPAIKLTEDREQAIQSIARAQEEAAKLIQQFNIDVQVRTGEAIDRAFNYADRLASDMITKVKGELVGISRPRVMVVEIEKKQHKLKKPATAYLPRMLVNAKLGLNTMLVGPAGSGKTVAASQVAEALGLEFGHVCLTAGASETWLFGRQTPNGFVEGTFSRLYRQGGVFLADEMDAADANLLLAINTALANGHLYNPISGENIARNENFVFIGACNTVGRGADAVYTGRARLDGATLTRFIKIMVNYSNEIEEQVCPDDDLRKLLQAARSKLADLSSPEIISTRCMEAAYLQRKAGVSLKEILESLTMGWNEELVKQCGLTPSKPVWPEEVKKSKKKKHSDGESAIVEAEEECHC
jgi:MoxR-like ATPase